MTNVNQIKILLAVYYFDSKKINDKFIKDFTNKFNTYFNTSYNGQNVLYNINLFKQIDPSYSINTMGEEKNKTFKEVWDYYISNDRIQDLKKIYLEFKKLEKNVELTLFDTEDDVMDYIENNCEFIFLKEDEEEYIVSSGENNKIDVPKKRYEENVNTEKEHYRDANVVIAALKAAFYKCEYSENHIVFERKKSNVGYTEAHHLIPLKYQDEFEYNLDVEANVVSLCSNCHNCIHYGKDYKEIIKKLYENRYERLKKCGLDVQIDKLIKMYE